MAIALGVFLMPTAVYAAGTSCAINYVAADCPSKQFTDLNPGEWYHLDVDYVVSRGLMLGVGNSSFGANTTTTRGMIVTILYRMSGESVTQAEKSQCGFQDVPSGEYYADAVAWASARGIVKGISNTQFAPNMEITREQMISMLRRYSSYWGLDISDSTSLSEFADASSVSSWALEDMKWASATGMIQGIPENGKTNLKPQGSTLRIQAAAFIHRFCEKQVGDPISIQDCELKKISGDQYSLSFSIHGGYKAGNSSQYYIVQKSPYGNQAQYDFAPIEFNKSKNDSIQLEISGTRDDMKDLLMYEYSIAVLNEHGQYQLLGNRASIENPELLAENTSEIFKAASKKGLQGIAYASNGSNPVDARHANTKQALFNLDIAEIVGAGAGNGYVTYQYKGKNYYFSDCSELKKNIQSLNDGYEQYLYGNSDTTKVAVSLCLLLSYDSSNSYLIDPAARTAGYKYYLPNVREEQARQTLEALFLYLGEILGQESCYVTNWILGNEVNSSRAWNYGGSLSFDAYMECYATVFELLYRGVKAQKTGNTVSISLDNGWTAVPDTYAGKTTLDTFAQKINALDSKIQWSIAYHAYSYPLYRNDFWNDLSNTTDNVFTPYISMRNIRVLTDYAASLEGIYRKSSGSIRVLLTEQGFSSTKLEGPEAYSQAEALARGYYIAEFNERIDAFIIRAISDDSEEVSSGLYFGLLDWQEIKKTAFYIYEYMDSDLTKFAQVPLSSVSSGNQNKLNDAKTILCNTNWESIIPGFSRNKLAAIK